MDSAEQGLNSGPDEQAFLAYGHSMIALAEYFNLFSSE